MSDLTPREDPSAAAKRAVERISTTARPSSPELALGWARMIDQEFASKPADTGRAGEFKYFRDCDGFWRVDFTNQKVWEREDGNWKCRPAIPSWEFSDPACAKADEQVETDSAGTPLAGGGVATEFDLIEGRTYVTRNGDYHVKVARNSAQPGYPYKGDVLINGNAAYWTGMGRFNVNLMGHPLDLVREISDAPAAPTGLAGDIASAPRDGSAFLATGFDFNLPLRDRHFAVAWWSAKDGHFQEGPDDDPDKCGELRYLTHWQPLPAPPTALAAAKEGGE